MKCDATFIPEFLDSPRYTSQDLCLLLQSVSLDYILTLYLLKSILVGEYGIWNSPREESKNPAYLSALLCCSSQ